MLRPWTVGQVARYADGASRSVLQFFNRTTQDGGQRVPCLSQAPVGQQLHRGLDTDTRRRALLAFPPGRRRRPGSSQWEAVGVYAWGVYGRGASGRGAAAVVVAVGGPMVIAESCSGQGLPATRGAL